MDSPRWSVPSTFRNGPNDPEAFQVGLSDAAESELLGAIEAKLGRPLELGDHSWLLDEVNWARYHTLRVHNELARGGSKDLGNIQKQETALRTVIAMIDEQLGGLIADDAKRSSIDPLEITLKQLNDILIFVEVSIKHLEGSRIRDAILKTGVGLPLERSRSNKKTALELLVYRCLDAWMKLTGEAAHELRIGHPDHPGPFLIFLKAAAEGLPGGITLNSLHAKARTATGRRG